jgi:hypothetical protein
MNRDWALIALGQGKGVTLQGYPGFWHRLDDKVYQASEDTEVYELPCDSWGWATVDDDELVDKANSQIREMRERGKLSEGVPFRKPLEYGDDMPQGYVGDIYVGDDGKLHPGVRRYPEEMQQSGSELSEGVPSPTDVCNAKGEAPDPYSELVTDIYELSERVATLEEHDVLNLREDIDTIDEDVDALKDRVASLAESLEGLAKRVAAVEGTLRTITNGTSLEPCVSQVPSWEIRQLLERVDAFLLSAAGHFGDDATAGNAADMLLAVRAATMAINKAAIEEYQAGRIPPANGRGATIWPQYLPGGTGSPPPHQQGSDCAK